MNTVDVREAVYQAVTDELTKMAQRQRVATFKIHCDSILRIASSIADNAVERVEVAELVEDVVVDLDVAEVTKRDTGAVVSVTKSYYDRIREVALDMERNGDAGSIAIHVRSRDAAPDLRATIEARPIPRRVGEAASSDRK